MTEHPDERRQRERDFDFFREASRRFADVPVDELEREVAKAIAEVRAEMAEERRRAAEATGNQLREPGGI